MGIPQVPLLYKRHPSDLIFGERPVENEPANERAGAVSFCDLELKFENARRTAGNFAKTREIDLDWTWSSGDVLSHVKLLPRPLRAGHAYSLETPDWVLLVAPLGSVLPRLTFQYRSDYLRSVGPSAALVAVKSWTANNVLPLLRGVPNEACAKWTVSRIDLAADLAGVALRAEDLERFTTRAAMRREHHAAATGTHLGRRLTGFDFGKRGGGTYARIYDKTEQAHPDAQIREDWANVGYRPADHGAIVWRVEFEVRPGLLRELVREDGSRISGDTSRLLREDLDSIWVYLTSWLCFRTSVGSKRLSRREPEPWWRGLSAIAGFSEEPEGSSRPTRSPSSELDPIAPLKMALSYLAIAAFVNGDSNLSAALSALAFYAESEGGQMKFFELYARAEARRDASRSETKEAVRARAKELSEK